MKRALITGGSSGIGLALGRELSARGWAVALLARRESPAVPNAISITCDVTSAEEVRTAVRSAEKELGGALDLAVANAGVSIPSHATNFRLDDAEQTIRVNVLGMMYLFDSVIPSMVERRTGTFAGVASLAGLRGLPGSGPYSASKAAMQAFLEASRIELKPYGVHVTTVNPGFVATPMTEKNRFKMPFLMTDVRAAKIMADGLERGSHVIEFPLPTSMLMRMMRILPSSLYAAMTEPYGRRKTDPARVKR
jgi:NAD(P)-dependent dehydrogenase (short-subunit alcohol dehydrogenase family)